MCRGVVGSVVSDVSNEFSALIFMVQVVSISCHSRIPEDATP